MKPLTGRKVLAIAATAFAVILAPNLILAFYAVTTFSGLIVPNSYVASQEFDARRQAQESLDWTLELAREDRAIHLSFTDAAGRPVRPAALAVTVGRPTSAATDRPLDLVETAAGYAGPVDLGPGNWLVLVEAEAPDGTAWSQRHTLYVGPRS